MGKRRQLQGSPSKSTLFQSYAKIKSWNRTTFGLVCRMIETVSRSEALRHEYVRLLRGVQTRASSGAIILEHFFFISLSVPAYDLGDPCIRYITGNDGFMQWNNGFLMQVDPVTHWLYLGIAFVLSVFAPGMVLPIGKRIGGEDKSARMTRWLRTREDERYPLHRSDRESPCCSPFFLKI